MIPTYSAAEPDLESGELFLPPISVAKAGQVRAPGNHSSDVDRHFLVISTCSFGERAVGGGGRRVK